MSVVKLAYLAGLIDGEGTIGLYIKNHRKDYSLRLAVYNTDETLMDWLFFNIGGAKHKVGSRRKPNHKQEYCWYVSSSTACDLLKEVLPYLVIKRTRASIVIEAWENRCPTPRGERLDGVPLEVIQMRKDYIERFKKNTIHKLSAIKEVYDG